MSAAPLGNPDATSRRVVLAAPAKVNLALEVLGLRADGYHDLETVFHTLELADIIEVVHRGASRGSEITLTCDDLQVPQGSGNLAWRAVKAFIEETPAVSAVSGHFAIHLSKCTPTGAGLGGGSSDAAAVLRALNGLFPGRFSAEGLAALALNLGSDVPFFLMGGMALGTSRGECLCPLADLPSFAVTVLMPGISLSTPAVFSALTGNERGPRTARGQTWWRSRLADCIHPEDLRPLMHNRLADAAQRICPELDQLLNWLAGQDAPFLMTGSGAACIVMGTIDPPPGIRVWHTALRPRARLDSISHLGTGPA